MKSWDEYFLDMANLVSTRSKDKSTKVGSVLVKEGRVISTGYNGIPRGMNDNIKIRHEQPEKYFWFVHSELNAILNCAREGVSTYGSTLYTTLSPCSACAGAIIQAGIKKVIVRETEIPDRWKNSVDRGKSMFHEVKIDISYL